MMERSPRAPVFRSERFPGDGAEGFRRHREINPFHLEQPLILL